MRLLNFLLLVSTSTVYVSGHDNDDNRPPSPPEWPLNPGWGSWGGNWGMVPPTGPSSSSNSSSGAPGTGTPSPYGPQMWGTMPGPYFGQNPNAPLPMFYPPNWNIGGYHYPPQQVYAPMPVQQDKSALVTPDDLMTVDESLQSGQTNVSTSESEHTNMTINRNPEDVDSQSSKDTKGKGKATADEVREQEEEDQRHRTQGIQRTMEDDPIPPEVLAITHRLHERDRASELEERLKQAHGSLARALERNRLLERELDQAKRGTKQPLSTHQDDDHHGK